MTTLASNVRSVLLSASEVGSPRKFRRDTVLFRQDQGGVGMVLIESGLIKLTRTSSDGSKLILSVLGASQLAGDECLTQGPCAYLTDFGCVTDVVGYHVPRDTIRRLLSYADLSQAVVNYILGRKRELNERVEMLTLRDVEYRVLYGLATLARLVKPNANETAFPIPMTQAEIASYVGATRETTSTTLSVLKARRLVTLSRRLVTTAHPDILIKAADDKLASATSGS